MAKERIYTIDIARAISIMLVVAGHFKPDGSPDWWMSIYHVLHTFRMPLFLAVSGYTYIYLERERADKRRSYGKFVLHKFQRLMIPYFFISVFVIGTKLLLGSGATDNPVSWASFHEMFYYPAAAPFVWFVYVLFFIFLVVPLFKTRKGLAVLFVAALILHFAPVHLPDKFLYVSYIKNMLVFFVAGCLFHELRNVRAFVMNMNFLVFVVLFVLFYMAKQKQWDMEDMPVCSFMASLTGAALIIKIAKFISETGKVQQVFLSVSACSYTIYLFHTTFEGFTKAVFAKLPLQLYIGDTAAFVIEAVTVISAGIILPMILHYVITRKSKIVSYLIGAKYKKQSLLSGKILCGEQFK
ncbi:MAG: acyltransferase [Bacteroidales bacterium]|jgi:fucose 4-O-acetylase-like acetyltransferase|nr:acyltransferase [Bacteroidales bacterium]